MFRDDVDRLFTELFPGSRHGGAGEGRAPVDVYVSDGDPPVVTVELDVAGIDPRRVEVAIHDDLLIVRGERRRTGQGRRVYQHAEISWGPFERRVRLGASVDPAAATATYENGLLRIALPLAPRPPLRRVEISVRRPA